MSVQAEAPVEAVVERSGERIARNAGAYFGAQILSWVVTFVTLSIIPRALGAQVLGETVLAGATVQTVFGFGMLSMECHVVREVGRRPDETGRLLRGLFGLRLALIPALVVASMVALRAVHASERVQFFGALTLIGSILMLFAEPLRYALAGLEQAKRVSVTDLLLTFAPLGMIPLLRYGALAYYFVNTLAMVAVLILRARWVGAQARLRPTVDLPVWKELIVGGVPFTVTSMIGALYGYAGIFVLHHYVNDAAVGQYSQAGRLIGTFLFVPTVLNTAMLPSLTRMAQEDPIAFQRAQLRVLSVLIVVALPLMVGVILLARPLCAVLYGPDRFTELPLALQCSAFTILPLYIVSTIYQFLVAQRRNAIWTYFMIGTLFLYTGAALILVPVTVRLFHNGVVGAVAATVIAEGASSVAAFVFLKTNPLTRSVMGRAARSLVATAGMTVAIVAAGRLAQFSPGPAVLTRLIALVVPAAAGVVAFIALMLPLRALPPQEQALLLGIVRRKLGRG